MSISSRSLLFRAGTLLLAAACAPAPPAGPGAVPPPDSPPVTTRPAPPPAPPPAPAPPAAPVAPWARERLAPGHVPAVFVAEWRKAANRATCALIAPANPGAGAVPRAAYFAGGWSVAYDRTGLRSAFGVAGTGSRAADQSYDEWPHRRTWSDGSSAGYGPEGGTGPNELAYLRIQGQDCLYNVWSRLGVAHLEQLLESLRFVDMP